MKLLDTSTVGAIANIIDNWYQSHVIGSEFKLQGFFERSGVQLDGRMISLLRNNSAAVLRIMNAFNGTPDFERVILRLASPKEHAGNHLIIGDMIQALDQALWPEGLKIEMVGPDPRLVGTSAPDDSTHKESTDHNMQRPEDTTKEAPTSNEVFIIHGRDSGSKDTVARFLEEVDLKPVILQELSGQGRTIIEKFEEHSQVGFAIALLTPDDLGGLKSESEENRPRARQNVIFELGYFIGKLGRRRVCVLQKGEVEIPSDYAGVEYILFSDTSNWKLSLIKELQSAGFNVDANKATRRP